MPLTKLIRPLGHTAVLLCAALAGLGLGAGQVEAQTGPLAAPYTSPPQPTPYQWPNFHSGGGPVPAAQYPVAPSAAAAPYLTPLIDPLQSQLQGTPTELYNGSLTQIPSYLLGDYDPTRPPAGLSAGINTYYPNHFADGTIFSWAAPFSYLSQGIGTVTVDDDSVAAPTAPNAFSSTGFAAVTDPVAFPAAGTATGGGYRRLPPNTNGQAVWTLSEPVAGNYSLYFHIPNDLPDASANPETRSTAVTYAISVRDGSGNVTSTLSAVASQTEANDSQFLAGPFQVDANGTVVVTLLRNASTNAATLTLDYLVADSMSLQQTTGDVQSAPTVITRNLYSADFSSTIHPLQYWGIYVPATVNAATNQVSTNTNPATAALANALPDTTTGDGLTGNILLKTGNPATALGQSGIADPTRLIRQLVYFGRSDPAASITATVDDSSTTAFSTGAVTATTITTPNLSAATASNGEYRRYSAASGTVLTPLTLAATWTVPVPATAAATGFFVYAHIPANLTGEKRLAQVYYTVTVNGGAPQQVAISQVTQGTDALVVLPTGTLFPAVGSSIVVRMYNVDGVNAAPPVGSVVVADSINITTGTGQGAIYCVDGFTGGVVWRYETPGSANGASAPVFASPAIARINVLITPAAGATPAVYANRLVVIVGDNNGLVYCLDAIGNGDGTSNFDVLDTNLQPKTIAQPAYGGVYGAVGTTPVVAGTPVTPAVVAAAHVGTTGVYWIYRPDASRPKYISGTNLGKIKPIDPTTDLPVPAAFNTASPTVFVDPTVNTAAPTASNAIVYIGNSNGVLYALDALGKTIDTTSATTLASSGDTFNDSQDAQVGVAPIVPTPQPLWWFSLRGVAPNSALNASSADIESAPALYVKVNTSGTYVPTVYIGSAHEQEVTSNVGRLYALNGLYGPSFNNGRTPSDPAATGYGLPGTFNYNVGQRPQTRKTDTTDWSFPDAVGTDAYSTGQSSTGKPRPALGNVTGSPVVFTNIHETTAAHQTRIYIAANSGLEYPATARPDDTQTGRLWAVNLDGSVGTTTNSTASPSHIWAYPLANDPNNSVSDTTAEPQPPIGSFLRGTPAIGFVQFPATITNGDGNSYAHADAYAADVKSASVPMLYVGTRGVNDTALYAVDIDGDMTATTDQRTIYRQVSPDGSIYQSSPALVTNATTTGGNGGGVYAVAGSTLYDYSATPISNPFAGEAYPLIREDKAFIGFGPISSPAIAGADVTDINNATFTTYTTNTTDWVYCGDSSSGLCRGITPQDASYGGIPTLLSAIVPPAPNPPVAPLLDAVIQTYLLKSGAAQSSTSSADANPVGSTAPLPVYEWGESAYVRFTNVAPPNPTDDKNLYVYDSRLYTLPASPTNIIPFYTSDGTTAQTVSFNLSDFDSTNPTPKLLDNGSVRPQLITTPPDGFVKDTGTLPASFTNAATVTNLVANNGNHYLGTYTYTIADGTARNNSPGARRRFQNVKQVVTEYDYDGSTYTKMGTAVIGGDATANNIITNPAGGSFSEVAAVDQPTFGILNPLGVRGGGVDLLQHSAAAVPLGDELGPFRSVQSLPTISAPTTGDSLGLQALTNGNAVISAAPPSSSGVAGNSTVLPQGANDLTGVNTPTNTAVVVTTTGLIAHNTTGDNGEPSTVAPTGTYGSPANDGLSGTQFGGYSLDLFDRGALFNLGQSLRVKMTVPTGTLYAPPSGRDALYWNSNVVTDTTLPLHGSVVNFLPWETAPTPYAVGSANGSQDYPDIAPGNIAATAKVGGDLTSNNVTLPQGSTTSTVPMRTVTGDPVQIRITVPHYQPANQQLYQETRNQMYKPPVNGVLPAGSQQYDAGGQTAPATDNGGNLINTADNVFPMGYVTVKRIYVPSATGYYSEQRPYRDVRIYTGVPVDMRTSIVNPTTDIGKAPAAFGVQTENDPNLGLFTPFNTLFQSFFKPLEVHNDGNVNLLNVHFDQKISNGAPITLALRSDAVDPLSAIAGFDLNPAGSTYGITGPRTGTFGNVPEQPYLIRSSLDTDLVRAYDRNPNLPLATYPGATFHKPTVGGSQPSVLAIPDSPENLDPTVSVLPSPTGQPASGYSAPPFVSIALPFGTPVGTYATSAAPEQTSLRLFEGLDTAALYGYNASNLLYPPQYGKAVGGIGTPVVSTTTGEPLDSNATAEDIYNGAQPLSTMGTQLIGTVVEQRLTDGATYGAVPMIDAGSAGPSNGGGNPTSTPDFAPAAFRDPSTGSLSVYWTSGRGAGFGIYGANLPFHLDPATADQTHGYFLPSTAPTAANPTGEWWTLFSPTVTAGTNSGFSVAPGAANGIYYGFDTAVTTSAGTPYSNTLYGYDVNPGTGALNANRIQAITPPSNSGQVKYGVKGLYTGYTNNNGLYAFWTGLTHGRTALYYSAKEANGTWSLSSNTLPALLPIPAGLTSVSDASPLLIQAPVNGALASVIEVTYSGTGPDGNVDLYVSRYQPVPVPGSTSAPLTLVPLPAVTENLRSVAGGWYQARDVAWSRTGALNVFVNGMPILYSTSNVPLFAKAIYDKASGLLVLTGVKVQNGTGMTTNTLSVDAATGRVRFSPALLTATTQNFPVQATFSPLARRLTTDSRADTAPVTFLDQAQKPNDGPGLAAVTADRRWTIWRKAGVAGVASSATLYYKTQRLTFFLPNAIALSSGVPQISSVKIGGTTDVTSLVDVDYSRGRIYFPISAGGTLTEGQSAVVTYTNSSGVSLTTSPDTIQWQDEPLANNNDVPATSTAAGLDTVLDNAAPIDTAINENNVAAFLDPFASATNPHKVWLFWNSTRNGTADIYSETIDPRFAPGTQ